MKTLLGTEIPKETKGIVYLCKFHYTLTLCCLQVKHELFFETAWQALDAYANIPNPESQLVTAKTYEELCEGLEILHQNMQNKEWLDDLYNCL